MKHAIALLDRLAEHGFRHAVVCPGSRSTPLALAAEHHPDITTHVIIDERSGAYFALGIAKATRLPVVVITTSGTAVANLLPACIEAHQSNVPLLLLTADRPAELRDTGANQTMRQPGLFDAYTRRAVDAPHPGEGAIEPVVDAVCQAMAAWPPGPGHINQPLREPLAPDDGGKRLLDALTAQAPRPEAVAWEAHPDDAVPRRPEGDGIVICGPGTGDIGTLDAVVLADALSGTPGLGAYDAYLEDAPAPAWILQLGQSPTSKKLRAYLAKQTAPRIKVDASGRGWNDIPGDVTIVACDTHKLLATWSLKASASWRDAWEDLERRARDADAQQLAEHPEAEPAWVPAVLSHSKRLFVGNSMPVRHLDRYGERIQSVFANRGVSGIDGTIATAAGIAQTGPLTAVIGDVAFQHDVGSLALIPEGMRLVVIDNGGGRIFERLPIRDATPHFERLFLTPPLIDIQKACEAFGRTCTETTPSGLTDALRGDAQVIVVRPTRDEPS